MFCSKCGKEIPNNTAFCPNCGTPCSGSSSTGYGQQSNYYGGQNNGYGQQNNYYSQQNNNYNQQGNYYGQQNNNYNQQNNGYGYNQQYNQQNNSYNQQNNSYYSQQNSQSTTRTTPNYKLAEFESSVTTVFVLSIISLVLCAGIGFIFEIINWAKFGKLNSFYMTPNGQAEADRYRNAKLKLEKAVTMTRIATIISAILWGLVIIIWIFAFSLI